jgi:hypothetical protein
MQYIHSYHPVWLLLELLFSACTILITMVVQLKGVHKWLLEGNFVNLLWYITTCLYIFYGVLATSAFF